MGHLVACICGSDHELPDDLFNLLMLSMVTLGASVRIQVPGGIWDVPRVYLAVHGVKASELPQVASRYGFSRLA